MVYALVGVCQCSALIICCFFFKQKTAYEMRISDWSSDVCSSDLPGRRPTDPGRPPGSPRRAPPRRTRRSCGRGRRATTATCSAGRPLRSEERRVGKECVIRVDLGGRRIITKTKTNSNNQRTRRSQHNYLQTDNLR